MREHLTTGLLKTRDVMKSVGANPAVLAFLPAMCLGAVWFGGEMALAIVAIVVPVMVLFARSGRAASDRSLTHSARSGLMQRMDFEAAVAQSFEEIVESGLRSALFIVELDDTDGLVQRHGQSGADQIAEVVGKRVADAMRDRDLVCQTGDFQVSVCLEPVRLLDLERCIQLAGRLQSAVDDPILFDGKTVHLSSSVGFCQNTRVTAQTGKAWVDAAAFALKEARHQSAGSIRAYSDEMRKRSQAQANLHDEVSAALERGQIHPWFQPQISTDTGLVTGFEALARWDHPTRGMIPPSAFLPAIEQTGLLEALADTMMHHAFAALKVWDEAGVLVPQVGVNFAGPELNNPKLVEKVKWQLDRFDLAPSRLAVEVLETVVTSAPDDTITRNISGLGKLGCKIDLDDFGTGHASIASIRRFSVSRIKIDRSFVMKADRDPEQQRMISAILTMAERLGVETLAEGVETAGEHALLAQLGCNHVQGFGIGKPMPFAQTFDWIADHTSKLKAAPQILTKRQG